MMRAATRLVAVLLVMMPTFEHSAIAAKLNEWAVCYLVGDEGDKTELS